MIEIIHQTCRLQNGKEQKILVATDGGVDLEFVYVKTDDAIGLLEAAAKLQEKLARRMTHDF